MKMPQSMNALVLHGPNQFSVRRVPVPRIESDEVLCEVDTTYICGTDPHILAGDFPDFWPKSFPFIPGHEWSGVIVAAGERAQNLGWEPGGRVCAVSHCGCGYCGMCMAGRYNLCLNYGHEERGHRQYGHYTPGAYAQYMRVSVKSIYRIPDTMSLDHAACIDPLSIALHMVKKTGLHPGDDITVIGSGPQGLMAVVCAGALGAGRIFAVGSGERLRRAVRCGATGIDYTKEDVVKRVGELTDGFGTPAVAECAGTPRAFEHACAVAARGGTVAVIGLPLTSPVIPVQRIVLDEIDVRGVRANPNTAPEAISLAANRRVDLSPLITHRFSLVQFAEALETFVARKDGALKVAVKPNSGYT